jgi:N-acetyl-anhydromuramyl-L-alanine amidase AmpD
MKFTEKDLQFILEALLFSSSCDVSSDWYKEDLNQFFKIAKQIRKEYPSLQLRNVFIHNPFLSEQIQNTDQLTPDIISVFPEILKEDI